MMTCWKDIKTTGWQVNSVTEWNDAQIAGWWNEKTTRRWKDDAEMKQCWDGSVLRIRWRDEMAGWRYRWWRVDRIEFREKKEHPSPPVESTTGPCPTSSQRCRTPQHCKFPFAPPHHPLDNDMDRVKRIWFLSPMRAAKVQASLRIRAVSPEPPLLAHTSSESRGTFRQKTRSLAPLNGWACAVKICHDGMLEDTNSLDAAHM